MSMQTCGQRDGGMNNPDSGQCELSCETWL